jgi:hypothetical protein
MFVKHLQCVCYVCNISSAPWYARNTEIHEYLEVPTVSEEARQYSAKYKDRLTAHPNPLSAKLLEPNPIKRLKRANMLRELDES